MKRIIVMLIKLIGLLIALVALLLIGLIIHGTLTVYKPQATENLNTTSNTNQKVIAVPNQLSFMIWNVGYCGLGKQMDFFYDGGKTVFGLKDWAETNLEQNAAFIAKKQHVDFILLQEVDQNSKRSYKINQYQKFSEVLPNHNATFATNYKVQFLPFPFNKPIGKILSGLASFSLYKPLKSTRYQFPGSYAFPKSNYLLKRCFLMQRFVTPNNKQLLVINTHNSAYDSGGTLKKQEMEHLQNILLEEYNKGNYLVVGGDWNQIPGNFNNDTFKKTEDIYEQIPIPADYLPNNWQWVFDPNVATNRKLEKPYQPNYTFTTIIDFYLISPNIELINIQTENLNFENSDHQPVLMQVRLK